MADHEEVLKHVARELHDNLGQALTIIKLRLGGIKKNLRKDQQMMQQQCDETLAYIDQVLESLRRLFREISPTIVEDLGLMAALRRLTTDFARTANIKVSLQMDDIDHLFSSQCGVAIYRIIQFALMNLYRHSQAEDIALAVKRSNIEVEFHLAADGVKSEPTGAQREKAEEVDLALEIINERIRILGGHWTLPGESEEGILLHFWIPIEIRQIAVAH